MKAPHLALVLGLFPSTLVAQIFVRQIERVRDGTVQLT
jgi:hypothetical protein